MATRWARCEEADPAGRRCRFANGHPGAHQAGDDSIYTSSAAAVPSASVQTGAGYRAAAEVPSASVQTGAGYRAPVSSMATPGERAIAEAKGDGGYIWVFPHKVRIKHSGLRGAVTVGVLKGDKELQIDQISGIQWRDAGLMWLGHIQFTLIGGSTDSRPATRDENALQFDKAKQPAFEVVRATVDRLMNEAREARRPLRPPEPVAPVADIPDQIRKLADLRDAGILSTAEFEAKKSELLARM